MGAKWPPSSVVPREELLETSTVKPYVWRERAWNDLLKVGWSIEDVVRLSGFPLTSLVKALGVEKVVWSLYKKSGKTMKEIERMIPSVSLVEIAKIIGPRTRRY